MTEAGEAFSSEDVLKALPIVDAILALLGQIPQVKPFTDPVRAGLNLGKFAIHDSSKEILRGLRKTHADLRSAREAEDPDEDHIRELEIRLEVYIELVTKSVADE